MNDFSTEKDWSSENLFGNSHQKMRIKLISLITKEPGKMIQSTRKVGSEYFK